MDLIQKEIVLTFSHFIKNELETMSLKLKSTFGQEAETLMLPVINDPNVNLPRLIIRYPQKGLVINVLNNQISFVDTANNSELIGMILSFPYSDFDMDIIRVGLVDTFFEEGGVRDKISLLNDSFSKLTISELNIRICQLINIGGISCNSIDKIDTGQATKNDNPGKPITGFIIQRDINTSQFSKEIIKLEDVDKLLKEFATRAFDITLKQ